MQVSGWWQMFDDGATRPVLPALVESATHDWIPVIFLVDTGADFTVFASEVWQILGFGDNRRARLSGAGGTSSVPVATTRLNLPSDDGSHFTFKGEFASFTGDDDFDLSVIGRDVIDEFAVIVDRPGNNVALVRHPYRYVIHQG